MLFSSTFFLFIFLPTLFILYYAVAKKQKARNVLLLLASLIFYAWGEPYFVLIMMTCIGMNYLFGRLIAIYGQKRLAAYSILGGMLVFNLGLLGVFKYLGFGISTVNSLLGSHLSVPQIALPIGISFFTFQGISYVLDVYRGKGAVLKNPLDVGLYIAFFPQLIAGPIVRYETVAREIKERETREEDFADGIVRFITGLAKKVILANQFAIIADKAYGLGTSQIAIVFAWMGAIAYMLQIYFDFAGYSDMAIGLGKMFGFHFIENFNKPYTAKSISDFWRRWHISLGSWFRDYVYIPLGGNRVGKWKQARNILVVWLLTGIWHGANWTFMAWGLYFGCFLLLEKFTRLGKWMERSKMLGHVYTLSVVLFGWVLFRADSIGDAVAYIKAMFGMTDNVLLGSLGAMYLKEYFMVYLIGIVMCLPLMNQVGNLFKAENKWVMGALRMMKMGALAVLFFIATAYLVKGTYNPFIYFNF